MIKVMSSSVVPAPVAAVWSVVRDFNGLPAWQPAVVGSVLEAGGASDRVGSVRALTMADGGKMRERLLALSDAEHSLTYAILESELPIENYRSTIRLQPVTDGGRTYITWESEFDVIGDRKEEMRQKITEGIFQPGFDTLKQRFAADKD